MKAFLKVLLPTPKIHTVRFSSTCVSSRLTQHLGDPFSPGSGQRTAALRLEWGCQSCPWSWKKGDPDLMAGYLFLPGKDALSLDSGETQADLSQDLEGSGEQEGELALTKEVIQSEGEEVEPCKYPNAFEDEEAMESEPSALDKDFQCPREEDTVHMVGSPECKTCHYLLVRTCRTFAQAQVSGKVATVEGGPGGEERRFNLLCPIYLDECFSTSCTSESPRSFAKTRISGLASLGWGHRGRICNKLPGDDDIVGLETAL